MNFQQYGPAKCSNDNGTHSQKSPVINKLIKEGKTKMIGAYYDVTSGKIYYEDDLKEWW